MSSRNKSTCQSLITWLKLNLGRHHLAALTGTDSRALAAAAHILSLRGVCSHNPALIAAFREVVLCMQPSTRELAYHAVAYLGEWDDRAKVWAEAGLPPLARVSVCDGERLMHTPG